MVRISKTKIERRPGFLYYLGKDGYVWGSPSKHNPGGKKYRAGNEMVKRPKGICWVDKEGYVSTKA